MSEPEAARPWWVVPSGHIHPIWWLVVAPLIIWADYVAGAGNQYPLLYVIPVCIAAWYSGTGAAVGLAIVIPLAQITFRFTVWNAPPDLRNLVLLLIRASTVVLIAL